MPNPNTLFLIALGFIPSIIWLILFFKKDPRPEPKYLIVRVFLFGIIIAPVVVLLESSITEFASLHPAINFISNTLIFFVWAAFVEEYMKYWIVKTTIIYNPNFDEPHDAIIYMITAALGFAAMENILILFKTIDQGYAIALGTLAFRFTGATLLHALASGIVGYFLGMAWFFHYFKKRLIATGLVLASLLHLAFNIIVFLNPKDMLPNTSLLLIGMLILLLFLFDKLKNRYYKMISRYDLSTEI